MATGDIKIANNFNLNASKPLDARLSLATIAERDALTYRYPGLLVYVENDKFYYWNSTTWAEFSVGGGGSGLSQREILISGTIIAGDNQSTGLIVNINVGGSISVIINGLITIITDDIDGPFYFSVDSGVTATSVYLGSTFYWNQSIAGYSLASDDTITFKGIN